MAPQVPPYPNALRARIKQAGYSFREVSLETRIPKRTLYDWAAGNRVIPHKDREALAALLCCPVEALAPLRVERVQYRERHPFTAFGRDIMNRLRRSLLRYAPALTSAALLSPLDVLDTQDHERVSHVLAKPSRVDAATISVFEAISATYWQMYRYRSIPSDHLLDYAYVHLQKVMHVGSISLPQAYQQHLCEIIADAAHLVGYIAWGLQYSDAADEAYTLALQATQESGNHTTHALILGHMAFAPMCSRSHEALPLILEAKQLATNGTPAVRIWVASLAAEIEASLHDVTAGLHDIASLRDLETAEQFVSLVEENDPSLQRTGCDIGRLPGYKGACYLHLHRAEEARETFTRSLALLSPTRIGSKAIDLTRLAEAHWQLGNVEATCSSATEAIILARQVGSKHTLQRIHSLRQRLDPAATTQAVRDLDEVLFFQAR